MAETVAYRRWVTLTRRCQFRQVLLGLNIRPPRHMFPKAAAPDREVPPPRTRGIRATARPVPQDSAEVCSPAVAETAYGCLAFFLISECTKLTMSGRMGALKTAGSVTFASVASPFSLYTVIKGLAAIFISDDRQSTC